MTIAFLPWPTSIYIRSKSACDLHVSVKKTMVRSPSDSTTVTPTSTQSHIQHSISTLLNFLRAMNLNLVCMYVCRRRQSFISFVLRSIYAFCGLAHLSCARELQWSECSLQVGGVGLEVVQSTSNAGLELRGALAGRAVRRDLVEGTHDCWCCREIEWEMFEISGNFSWAQAR